MNQYLTVFYLVSESDTGREEETNEYGDRIVATPIEIKVIGKKLNITQNEFYQAQAAGFKPELKLEMRSFEYKDEQKLKYAGKLYTIKRAYTDGGKTELTCYTEVNTGG